jgi:TonB family protein
MRSVYVVVLLLRLFASAAGVRAQSATPDADAKAPESPVATQSATALAAEIGTRQNPMVVVESVGAAQLKKHMATEYPQAAIDAKISGNVKIQALISKTGTVIATRTVWGPDALRAAAELAVARAEYTPMTLDGKPVYMATTVRLVFALDAGTQPPTKKMGELIAQNGQGADADALRAEQPFARIARTPGSDKLKMVDGASSIVKAAKLIHHESPDYPQSLKAEGVQGSVVLHGIIRKDGTLTDLVYVSGPQLLAPAAIKAVKKWRYEPTLLEDEPVDVDTTITVVFTLG